MAHEWMQLYGSQIRAMPKNIQLDAAICSYTAQRVQLDAAIRSYTAHKMRAMPKRIQLDAAIRSYTTQQREPCLKTSSSTQLYAAVRLNNASHA